MKKLVSTLALAAFLFGAVVGCTDNNAKPAKDKDAKPAPAPAADKTKDKADKPS